MIKENVGVAHQVWDLMVLETHVKKVYNVEQTKYNGQMAVVGSVLHTKSL
jgi:hypothetical protein